MQLNALPSPSGSQAQPRSGEESLIDSLFLHWDGEKKFSIFNDDRCGILRQPIHVDLANPKQPLFPTAGSSAFSSPASTDLSGAKASAPHPGSLLLAARHRNASRAMSAATFFPDAKPEFDPRYFADDGSSGCVFHVESYPMVDYVGVRSDSDAAPPVAGELTSTSLFHSRALPAAQRSAFQGVPPPLFPAPSPGAFQQWREEQTRLQAGLVFYVDSKRSTNTSDGSPFQPTKDKSLQHAKHAKRREARRLVETGIESWPPVSQGGEGGAVPAPTAPGSTNEVIQPRQSSEVASSPTSIYGNPVTATFGHAYPQPNEPMPTRTYGR
jgi:hypothetical protein